MSSAGAIFTDTLTDVLGDAKLVEDKRSNAFTVNFQATPADDSNVVAGSSLWQADAFLSASADGSGKQFSLTRNVLAQTNQDLSLEFPDVLDMTDVEVDISMRGLTCKDAQYLCVTLKANTDTSIEFTMTGRPTDAVLTDCVSMADRCQGKTTLRHF